MRNKFYLNDLSDSGNYYHPIFEAIYKANWHYYNSKEHPDKVDRDNRRCSIWNYLALGLDDFIDIESSILDYNRCFAKLLAVNPNTKIQILKAIHNAVPAVVLWRRVVNPNTKIQILKAIHNGIVSFPTRISVVNPNTNLDKNRDI